MLKQAKNIFFVGIKGVAMANLAVFLKKMGRSVYGIDVDEVFITDKLLKENKIKWQTGFAGSHLPENIDLIVYSAAHQGFKNPLITEAKKSKINVISQAELLGQIMELFPIKIAVSGCHGKTTTTSLLSYALREMNQKPSYIVGVPYFTKYQGADYQKGNYFVVEADEYGINPPLDKTPKFFSLQPNWVIGTNIDFDHPDVYKDIEDTKKAFIRFFSGKNLIVNIDDKNISQSLKFFKTEKIITFGFSEKADYQIIDWQQDETGSSFTIKDIGAFKISLFGKHNISNAAAVIVQLINLGFKPDQIKKAIAGFQGAERRLELVFKNNNMFLFDDYAHHPNEIKPSIEALKNRFKNRRVIVIFQPHTYSRTDFMINDFKTSLATADLGYILPIFASAREKANNFKINSINITEGKDNLVYVESNQKLLYLLKKIIKEGDVIVTMGAGDVYKLKEEIIKIISQNSKVKSQKDNLKLKIEENRDLSHFLTLRNHVKAEFFIEAKSREDLIEAKKYSIEKHLPLFMLGGGSNLAIIKDKLSGLILKNNYIDLRVISETAEKIVVSVSSGHPVSLLIAKSIQNGWSGFELHQGLPGTVGGAVYMNSKWTKPPTYFGDNLIYAFLIDEKGKVKKVDRKYFEFAYDYSILQKTHEVLLEAVFELKKTSPSVVRDKSAWALDYRKKTQPFGIASSGCFFRNITLKEKIKNNLPTTSAGYLIDKSGLKGFAVGSYFVSPIHANFIINKGNGRKEDLIKILNTIKSRVKDKFKIELKEEVIVI